MTHGVQQELRIGTTRGMKYISGYKAEDLVRALAHKHQNDTFVAECKNGSTYMASHLRLDAWVLLSTFSPLTAVGYEVKVSRQDFEQDQKWVEYLDVCHQFFFVCPSGMVRSDELPKQVGLIWMSQSGKLHTKKHAARRTPDPAKMVNLMAYVLMWRTKIVNDRGEENRIPDEELDGHLASIRAAVDVAKERNELAYFVKGHVREVEQRQRDQERDLKQREEAVVDFTRQLSKLGIVWDTDVNNWSERRRVSDEIAKLRKTLSDRDLEFLKGYGKRLTDVADDLQKMREQLSEQE